ncbi:hypothetical protein [Desulfofundulus salinus]|uniref:Uncharacterized protein n=1 Tax=Desulfofundulus salinus TaxID=2419843 RepID=A0A494WRC0_9FIRM|nr:hypothetical protein [Desulfofundulus salinum]RKO65758.1 hypothetical protein D7024_01435 [Desulfofundulus salinum]
MAVCGSLADSRGPVEWVALAGTLAGMGIISLPDAMQVKRKRAFAHKPQAQTITVKRKSQLVG